MSKAALDQFTKCSALDLASKGIRVNSINPSFVRTKIFEQWGISSEQFDELLKAKCRNFPINRLCEVTDTSAAIAYLADNNIASFLTGISLPVDGGGIIAGASIDVCTGEFSFCLSLYFTNSEHFHFYREYLFILKLKY